MANKNLNEVLGQDIKSVKELRAAIKEYQDTLVGADAESEQYKETTDKLRVAQDELKNVTKAGREGVIQYADSIAGLEKKYRDMYNAYRQFSEEYRNSAEGMAKAEELKELSEKLNNLKKDVGNYKDNIGRYAESVMDAFSKMGGSVGNLVGPFKTATQGITAFNATLKANPVGAVITLIMALVNAVKQLVGSIKDNEESQMRLNQAMASFQPMIDAAKNAMSKFGEAIVSVIEFVAKLVDMTKMAIATFTDLIGITKTARKDLKEQQKTYQELAKSVNDLTLKKREYQKANAEDKAEVERLREEASETTNLVEKKELLQQAKDKQAEIDARNIEVAKEELRILETQSSLTANSAEDNEKLAAAVAKVSEAEAQAAANMRQFNKQLNTVGKSATSAAGGMKNYREEAKKIYERTVEDSKSEIQKLTEKFEKEKALLVKYHKDTTLLTKQYNAELAKLMEQEQAKELTKLKTNYDYRQKVWIEQQKAMGVTADEITVKILENQAEYYNELTDAIKEIAGNTSMTLEDKVKEIKKAVDAVNQVGLDIEFPPKDWPATVEDQLIAVIKYVQAFGINLQNKLNDARKVVKENSLTEAFEKANKNIDTKVNLKVDLNLEELLKEFEAGITEQNYAEIIARQTRETLQVEQDALREEIDNFKGGQEQKLELIQRYYEVTAELRQMDWDDEKRAMDERMAQLDAFQGVVSKISGSVGGAASGIISLANGYKTLYNAEIQEGKLNKKEVDAKKKRMEKLEGVIKTVTIAQIAASTAEGIVSTWVAYANERKANATLTVPYLIAAANAASLINAVATTAGLVATAVGQIAAAKGGYISNVNSIRDEGSASSAGASVSVPTEIDSTPYTYSRTVQTAEEEDRLNQPIWVSVTDIESGLNNKVRVTDESSF